jgi:hypothetical protein
MRCCSRLRLWSVAKAGECASGTSALGVAAACHFLSLRLSDLVCTLCHLPACSQDSMTQDVQQQPDVQSGLTRRCTQAAAAAIQQQLQRQPSADAAGCSSESGTSADLDVVLLDEHDSSSSSDAKLKRQLLMSGVITALGIALHNFPEGVAVFLAAQKSPAIGESEGFPHCHRRRFPELMRVSSVNTPCVAHSMRVDADNACRDVVHAGWYACKGDRCMFPCTRHQQLLATYKHRGIAAWFTEDPPGLHDASLSLQHPMLHRTMRGCCFTALCCRCKPRHCYCAAQCARGRWRCAAYLLCNRQQAERVAGSSTVR